MSDAQKMQEAKANGMRFWIPGIIDGAPPDMKRADKPFGVYGSGDQAKQIVPLEYRNAVLKNADGRPYGFIGEDYVTDPQIARYLMQHVRGRLRFDPMEAHTKLGISLKEIREMGYEVGEPTESPEKEAPPPAKPALVRPNFHSMKKGELRKWADANGIFIAEGRKEDMVAELEAKLDELENASEAPVE